MKVKLNATLKASSNFKKRFINKNLHNWKHKIWQFQRLLHNFCTFSSPSYLWSSHPLFFLKPIFSIHNHSFIIRVLVSANQSQKTHFSQSTLDNFFRTEYAILWKGYGLLPFLIMMFVIENPHKKQK